ncbi:hypothetical protein ACHAW6_015997 [Cyclotella cf. meneghiniana]
MTIENKFRAYLAAFDGSKKDFSDICHIFEDIYDKDFVLHEDGYVVNREQIKRIHAKGFALGSTASLLQFSSRFVEDCSLGDLEASTVEFKFRLTNDEWDIVIHNIADVQGNKLIRAKPVENTKPIVLINVDAYINAFDGTPKDIASVNHLFDALYHDDFVYELGRHSMNKHEMKKVHANFLAGGFKASCLFFTDVGYGQIEYKFCIGNEKVHAVIHNIATVKDNKLIRSKPIDEASLKAVWNIVGASKFYEVTEGASSTYWRKSSAEIESGDVTVVSPQ